MGCQQTCMTWNMGLSASDNMRRIGSEGYESSLMSATPQNTVLCNAAGQLHRTQRSAVRQATATTLAVPGMKREIYSKRQKADHRIKKVAETGPQIGMDRGANRGICS